MKLASGDKQTFIYRSLYYKTYYGRYFWIVSSQLVVLVHGKPFQPSPMFVCKARGLPQSGAPEKCFNWVCYSLSNKHQTRQERLARYKHSSLLQRYVNYGRNKFAGKTETYPNGAPEKCFTWVGYSLTRKHQTRLERLARDKHYSLLQKSVNYEHNKFYSTGPRASVTKEKKFCNIDTCNDGTSQ